MGNRYKEMKEQNPEKYRRYLDRKKEVYKLRNEEDKKLKKYLDEFKTEYFYYNGITI